MVDFYLVPQGMFYIIIGVLGFNPFHTRFLETSIDFVQGPPGFP